MLATQGLHGKHGGIIIRNITANNLFACINKNMQIKRNRLFKMLLHSYKEALHKLTMKLNKKARKPTMILHLQKFVKQFQSTWRPYLFMQDAN